MGFKQVIGQVIGCLDSGCIEHEARDDIDVKNLLFTGEVSIADVRSFLSRASGTNYSCSPHHSCADIDVHVVKVTRSGKSWYIKWYFLDPDAVFISVH